MSGGWCPGDAPGPPAPDPGMGCLQQTSLLTCHAVTSGTTFRVRGEPGSRGTNPGKFLAPHSPSPTPSTVFSSRCGPASSRAMQCSRVEQRKFNFVHCRECIHGDTCRVTPHYQARQITTRGVDGTGHLGGKTHISNSPPLIMMPHHG